MPSDHGFIPNPPPRAKTPAAVPVGPAVVNHYHAPPAPKVSASQALAAVLLCLLLGLGAHDLIAHHWRGDDKPPAPQPAPIDGKIWVVLVKDANAPGQDFAQLEADPSLGEGINRLGGHLLIWGSDSPLLESRGLKGYFDKVGAPALLIEAEGHKGVAVEKCPMKAADVVARVKAFKETGR